MPALIFDCDGVLADTERDGHREAFNRAFEQFGLPVRWSDADYARKLLIGGGKERLSSLLTPEFVTAAGLPDDPVAQQELVARWHRRKTEIYAGIIDSGAIPARPGVARLAAEAAAAGWRLAVASTSAEPSVRCVLDRAVGLELAREFAVFAGDLVAAKKPAPDIYLRAVASLGVEPAEVVAVEDSRNGLRAALAAGLRCLVTVSAYTADEDFTGAALVVSSLGDPSGPAAEGVEMTVLADPFRVAPLRFVRLRDLATVLDRVPPPTCVPGA